MAVLRFGLTAFGPTREEVYDEIEGKVREILTLVGGEPWLLITDQMEKIPAKPSAMAGDPSGFIYVAKQEMIFTGPTPLGDPTGPTWRDGFRPQLGTDELF